MAVSSAFSLFWKQFWTWLKLAWKQPTQDIVTHNYNGVTVYGLLALFTTLTSLAPIMKSGYLTFSAFLTILLGFAFIFFAFILGGFIVKRLIYKEEKFTFGYSFEWFGRLLSLNLPLMASAFLFSFLGVYTLSALLTTVSYIFFTAAAGYTLFHTVNHSKLDMFYKYLLAGLLFGFILFISFLIGFSIAGEMLFNSFMGEIGNYISPYRTFGF